eukprot:scaffold2552_cov380-Prasinococcus_capsulatus_cf.AAC.26
MQGKERTPGYEGFSPCGRRTDGQQSLVWSHGALLRDQTKLCWLCTAGSAGADAKSLTLTAHAHYIAPLTAVRTAMRCRAAGLAALPTPLSWHNKPVASQRPSHSKSLGDG